MEQNPELYRFMLESVGKEYPSNVGKWDRQIDVAVVGMAMLGAIDKHNDPSNYVRVTPDSITRAQNKDTSRLISEIKRFDHDTGMMFAEAFACVHDANRELNDTHGSRINEECMVQGVTLYFDAYWQELQKRYEKKWFNG